MNRASRRAVTAAHPGETVVIDPTVEKPFHRFLHDRAQWTVLLFVEVGISFLEFRPVTFQTPVEGGVFGMPLPVSTMESHALPTTSEVGNNAK